MKRPLFFCLILAILCVYSPVHSEKASEFVGQPKFDEGENLGYFVWKSGDTWKVRWTTFGALHRFSGRVTVEGTEIKSFKRIDVDTERRVLRPGTSPHVVRGPRGRRHVVGGRPPVVAERDQDRIEQETDHLIRFTALTDDDIDGFDFKLENENGQLKFLLEIEGKSRVDQVKIGPYARRPSSNPMVVQLR